MNKREGYRSKYFTWRFHCSKLAPYKHTRSHSDSEIVNPLLDPERLIRGASSRRRHITPSSSLALHPKDIQSVDPFSFIPTHPDWIELPPRVSDFISRGVDLPSSFFIQSLESYQVPSILIKSPSSEEELGLHLPELKPQDFITRTPYSIPSSSTNIEETFSVYLNLLFENKEDFPPGVQKLVIKTPFKSLKKSPPSPPHINTPIDSSSSPSSSSSSSSSSTSTQTPYTPPAIMDF